MLAASGASSRLPPVARAAKWLAASRWLPGSTWAYTVHVTTALGVAEPLGDDVHRLKGGQQDRGVRVPQVVKPDDRQGLGRRARRGPGRCRGRTGGETCSGLRWSPFDFRRHERVVAGLFPAPGRRARACARVARLRSASVEVDEAAACRSWWRPRQPRGALACVPDHARLTGRPRIREPRRGLYKHQRSARASPRRMPVNASSMPQRGEAGRSVLAQPRP